MKRVQSAWLAVGLVSLMGFAQMGRAATIFLVSPAFVAPAGTDVSVPVFLSTSLAPNLVGGLAVRLITSGANGSRVDGVTLNGSFLPGSVDPLPGLNVGASELADIFATPFGVPLAADGSILIGAFSIRAPLVPGTSDVYSVTHYDLSGSFNFLADFTDIEPADGTSFTVRALGVSGVLPLPEAVGLGGLVISFLAAWRALRHFFVERSRAAAHAG